MCPGAAPAISTAPLYFPFVLPLSHHIFRNLLAARLPGQLAPLPLSRAGGGCDPGALRRRLLRVWVRGGLRWGAASRAAPCPSPRGPAGASNRVASSPSPSASIFNLQSCCSSPTAVFGHTGALLPGPLSFSADVGGGDLLLGVRHPQLEEGRPPLCHHPVHCMSRETETHRRKRPIMTTGRLVHSWDLSQVGLTPNPCSFPTSPG